MTLPTRELGRTGILVSLVGLGTVKFGRNSGVAYPGTFELPSDAQLQRLLDRATELGINVLDTAPAYGTSETRLGALLGTRRSRFVLCTKVGETFENGRSTFDFSPAHTHSSVERSLRRLRTDVLDVVLVHSHGNEIAIIENHGTLEALADLKRAGKIRAFGISHKTVAGGVASSSRCDVIMTTLNDNDRSQLPALDAAAATGCGVFIKKALGSGHGAATQAKRIANLKFVAAQSAVSSIIIGTISDAHLTANVATLSATG